MDAVREGRIVEVSERPEMGDTPADFATTLFSRTRPRICETLSPAALAALTEDAWRHFGQRTPGRHDLRIFNPRPARLRRHHGH